MPTLLSLLSHGRSNHHDGQPPIEPVPRQTFSATLMEENISSADTIISKWDLNSPQTKFTQLFSPATRDEAARFCQSVRDLQRSMVFFSSPSCPESPKTQSHSLVRAQTLMHSAMNRLEKELFHILSANEAKLGEITMADLSTISQTMISAGYGRECVKIYNMMRRSVVDEVLYRLGSETLALPQVQKLDWEALDLKIRSWLNGSRTAIRTVLSGERVLCDRVFDGSDPIRESCFADIAKDAALQLLALPELVARSKRSPEKLFRILDLHTALSYLYTDIESVFSSESTAAVRSQARSTILKLGEAARSTFAEFESAIQKDASKIPVPGGGVHPLARYVMNYLSLFADYEPALADIFAERSNIESPLRMKSELSERIAWIILGLLCNIDLKAKIYKDVALSYLFLANNLQYVVKKVRGSGLAELLGADWAAKHEAKVRHYAASYERLGWARVAAAVPSAGEPPEVAAEKVRAFYVGFEEAVRVQREWVVADERMREKAREMVADLVVPAYRGFYEAYRPVFAAGVSGDVAVIRYAPEDVRARIMELFSWSGGSDLGSGSGSGSVKSSWWSSSSTR